jgi:F0F1-type ATP synthase membrane subunit a
MPEFGSNEIDYVANRIIRNITKPFALMIRLFANMTAGHIVVMSLIG